MLKDICKKMEIDPKCELTKEELNVLYEFDNYLGNLDEYRNKRNNYLDFCKMFGQSYVAQALKEINENTIAYVGNLYIDEVLPTYNLRYVCGDIVYYLETIENFENLEMVYGDAYFDKISKYNGMENLRKITGRLSLYHMNKENDLSTIDYVSKLYISDLENAKGFILPQHLNKLFLLNKHNLGNAELLELSDNLKDIFIDNIESIRGLNIPKTVKIHSFEDPQINNRKVKKVAHIIPNKSSINITYIVTKIRNTMKLEKIKLYLTGIFNKNKTKVK